MSLTITTAQGTLLKLNVVKSACMCKVYPTSYPSSERPKQLLQVHACTQEVYSGSSDFTIIDLALHVVF